MAKMLTSSSTKKQLSKKLLQILQDRRGFTLIEILVALFLMTLVFTFVTNVNFTQRQEMDEITNNLERAIRFSANETAIRNVIVRIHFELGKETQTYSVEYGPDGQFVIPARSETEVIVLSTAEEEEIKKEKGSLNKKFNRVRELGDEKPALPKSIRLIAIGTRKNKAFFQGDDAAIYFFPNGEKDESIIILGNESEAIGISTEAFSTDIKRWVKPVSEDKTDELIDRQDKAAKEIFDEWLKA